VTTAQDITRIGTGYTDPSSKPDAHVQQLQAMVNVTDALKAIALVLADIRDGKKDDGKSSGHIPPSEARGSVTLNRRTNRFILPASAFAACRNDGNSALVVGAA
jgi:hypothetical protein